MSARNGGRGTRVTSWVLLVVAFCAGAWRKFPDGIPTTNWSKDAANREAKSSGSVAEAAARIKPCPTVSRPKVLVATVPIVVAADPFSGL